MTIKVCHDFETYSEADLFATGAHKYASDPSTEVLMLSWAVEHEAPRLWVPAEGEPLPSDLRELIGSPETEWHAFNASFERLIWWHVLHCPIPIDRFRCTMQHAWSLSFSGGLKQVGEQLGLPEDKKKDDRGRRLIQKFCKPAPKNHKASRYTPENAPDDWQEFKEYCVQDVVSEREIGMLLAGYPMPMHETALWFWDQDVNDRGMPVDTPLVDDAVKLEALTKKQMREEMNSLSYLDNANSGPQLLAWLQLQGIEADNVQKATLERIIRTTKDETVRRVLENKISVGKTSTTKWQAFQNATMSDGYVRGMFQFGGAQRTQRWAGRIVQLHNLKTPRIAGPDIVVDLVHQGYDAVQGLYGNPLGFLSETIRCAITAPEGMALVPCDLGSIESRWLGYMSGCVRINAVFAQGLDTYKDFATEFYGVLYEQVTKGQRMFSKPAVLGAGFQLGGPGLVKYAAGMGVTMTEDEGKAAIATWREMCPEVPAMWNWLIDACKDVIENWTTYEGYTVRIHRDDNFLMIDLPSGRTIYYYHPLVLPMIPPWEQEKIDNGEIARDEARHIPTVTYMGMNQYTKQWDRLTTHGGKVTENIDQACCRDILAFHMQLIEREMGPIIRGHVHDEAIALVPEVEAEQALTHVEHLMRTPPPWAPTLNLDASGFVTRRYRKD